MELLRLLLEVGVSGTIDGDFAVARFTVIRSIGFDSLGNMYLCYRKQFRKVIFGCVYCSYETTTCSS